MENPPEMAGLVLNPVASSIENLVLYETKTVRLPVARVNVEEQDIFTTFCYHFTAVLSGGVKQHGNEVSSSEN